MSSQKREKNEEVAALKREMEKMKEASIRNEEKRLRKQVEKLERETRILGLSIRRQREQWS